MDILTSDRQDVKEVVDYAAGWAFAVYDRVVKATHDHTLAGATADKVYRKLLDRENGRTN